MYRRLVGLKSIYDALSWAIVHVHRAGGFGVYALLCLILLQGFLPCVHLYILKILTESIERDLVFFKISFVLFSWAGLVLLEYMTLPLVQMMRLKINERVHQYFHLILMKKSNSLRGLESFETKTFQNEIAKLRDETSHKPLNLVYILTDSLKGIVSIVSILLLLSSMSGWIPLILACSIVPQVAFTFFSEKQIWDYSLFQSEDIRKMNRLGALCLDPSATKEIRIFNFGEFLTQKFCVLGNLFYKKVDGLRKQQYLRSLPFSLLVIAGHLCAIGWTLWNLKENRLHLTSLIVMIQSLNFLQREILGFIQDMSMLSPLISYFETFRKFVRQKDPIADGKMSCGPVQSIEFRNVSFSYADGSMVLKNLSFSVGRNERIAIVGVNGSGKSTLIKLLCRFYDPQEGSIFINGINLKEIDLSLWRKQLSVIFQDFGKYPLTLEENIGIADPMRLQDDDRFLQVVSKGELASLIQKLPEGMKTILGKEFSGKELSFGEWQKLAIARLFFRDSPIVALDEPTASLDPNAEHEIFQQLLQAFEGKMVFLITHRLNSVQACDRILLLKEGSILEDGTHLDLMLKKGEYYRLFSLQAQGYQTPEEIYASL